MTHFHDNSTDPFEISDEQLDQLLAKAELPQIEVYRKKKIQRNLTSLLRRSRRQRTSFEIPWAMGAVGAFAVCGLALMISLVLQPDVDHPTVNPNVASKIAPIESAPPVLTRKIVSHVVWYPAQPKRPKPLSNAIRAQRVSLQASLKHFADSEWGLALLESATMSLDTARHEASRQHDLQAVRALQEIQNIRKRMEARLVRESQSNLLTLEQKTVAFRKLCRCGSAQSLPFVLDHWANPHLQSDISNCAKRWANSSTIAHMVVSTVDLNLKTDLMSHLLDRGDSISVGLFLELTERQKLYSVAQRCGGKARHLPELELLSALRSNRLGIVRAAAITLSNVENAQITEHLLRLAQRPESAQAAVLALSARQDSQATRFIELASNDLRWSATVEMAQKKWSRLLAIN